MNLLNEVFITMDDKHNVDLREETDEIRTYRMMEFLKLLKYPIAKEYVVVLQLEQNNSF